MKTTCMHHIKLLILSTLIITTLCSCASLNNSILHEDFDKAFSLIESGADVNHRDIINCTPLFYAALQGNLLLVQKLIDKGAQANSINGKSLETPLHMAAIREDLKAFTLLVKNGANYTIKDRYGRTPLDLAVQNGHGDLLLALKKKKLIDF